MDCSHASLLLVSVTLKDVGKDNGLTANQEARADVNSDGEMDAADTSIILFYATAKGIGRDVVLEDFI